MTTSPQQDPPRPLIKERSRYEPGCDQEAFMVPLLREAIEAEIRQSPPGSGGTVLDVGCGEQPFRGDLEAKGWAYTSLDVQQNHQENVDIICALDGDLPRDAKERAFDLVICLEVLEHVFDWTAAVENLVSLVAPGGTLLVTVPFLYELHEEPYDFWRPTPHALHRAVTSVGMNVVSQQRLGDGWDVLGTILATTLVAPKSRALRHRALAKLFFHLHWRLMRALVARRPQRHLSLNSRYYLSNVLVATKPLVPATPS